MNKTLHFASPMCFFTIKTAFLRMVFLLASCFMVLLSGFAHADMRLPTRQIEFTTSSGEAVEFSVEIAKTPGQQAKGLMFRTELADKHGMFFHYNPPRVVHMWMKNTYIPLDIIFISPKKTVAYIHENATPHSLSPIGPDAPMWGVVELKAGAVEEYGIAIGDSARIIIPEKENTP